MARIRARVRRTETEPAEQLAIGDVTIDVPAHQVGAAGKPIALTPLEFDLLVALARKPRQVFTREVLLEQVWGYRHAADTRLVNVHVQRLRSKVERDPEHPEVVLTVRGVGYKAGAAVTLAPRDPAHRSRPTRRGRAAAPARRRAGRGVRRGLAALAADAGRDQHAGAVHRGRAGARASSCRPRSRARAAGQGGRRADQIEAGAVLLERELSGVDPDREGAQGELNNALDRLTNSSDAVRHPRGRRVPRGAGHHGDRGQPSVSAGPLEDVPLDLRESVADGARAVQYVTVDAQGIEVPALLVGQPVRTANGDLEFYLLFPLDRSSARSGLVQSTLIVGGLVLLLLLAGIASIVTRQVVRPVRQAAEIAERFADGHLDERMPVQRRGRAGPARRVVQRDGGQHRGADPAAGGVRRPAAAVHLRRQPRAAHAADHRPDGRRRAARVPRRAAPRAAPQLGAAGHASWTGSRRCSADLLEISRLDAGVADLGAERIDMRGVVARAVEAVRGIADESGHPAGAGPAERGVRRGRPAPGRADRAQPGGQRDRPRRGPGRCGWCSRPTSTPSRCWSATTASGCARARRAWCSTGSGGPRSRGPGAAAAAGWGCPSPSRTPGCTAAGCRPGASRARARCSG